MGLESTATYINDLQPTNPTSTDGVSQGDDHLRLIKQVLQNQFPNATRTFPIPGQVALTASSTLVKNNGGSVVFVSTVSGPVTITLPTLAAADVGWSVSIMKYSGDANPVFISPGTAVLYSGTFSVSKGRRCIPGVMTTVVWNGSGTFLCSRAIGLPIGTLLDFWGSTLPAGYEWPNGQTLASVATNYPEFNAAYGSGALPDLRGLVTIPLDNLGGTAAGRLPSGYIAGSTFGAVGGVDGVALAVTHLPSHNHPGTTATSSDSGHTHTYAGIVASGGIGGGTTYNISGSGQTTGVGFANITTTVSVAAQGGGAAHNNLQPSIMCGKIMVVE